MSSKGPIDFHAATGEMFKGMAKLANEQTSAQDEVVDIITTMCDSLESASDLIRVQLSSAITDLNREKYGSQKALQRCLAKQTKRFSTENLSRQLHAGKVCGDLRKLGKRFGNPLSKQARGAMSILDWLKSLFRRSSPMKKFVDDLYFDERRYIDSFRNMLHGIVVTAEKAASLDNLDLMRAEVGKLDKKLRAGRTRIRKQIRMLRATAEKCMSRMH